MKCDTCKKDVPEVSRVVIYVGYNRLGAPALYNCPECFALKEQQKPYNQSSKKEKEAWEAPQTTA